MISTTKLLWFIILAMVKANATPVTTPTSTTTTTERHPVNTIDVLQNQLNQILVQFCASEIDRNKTASALLKFGQLIDAKTSVKNVVEFYVENYEDSFDNLLVFINHIQSFELQLIAYNTLAEAVSMNELNVINLLSFENFLRSKLKLVGSDHATIEQKFYEDLLVTLGIHIKELIVSTDLNRVIAFIYNTTNPDRIFDLIPTIVHSIDLKNFTDMDRIFQFSHQLPIVNQIKLTRTILSEMRAKTQYRHIFHVICQINGFRKSIQNEDKCLLSALEQEIPSQLINLISTDSKWNIRRYQSGSHLKFIESQKYSKTILAVANNNDQINWNFYLAPNSNSLQIRFLRWNYGDLYLAVEYCFHNDAFPTMRAYEDAIHKNWYPLFNDDLTFLQIKNKETGQLLIVDSVHEMGDKDVDKLLRVALSAKCSDCEATKWSFILQHHGYSKFDSSCPVELVGDLTPAFPDNYEDLALVDDYDDEDK